MIRIQSVLIVIGFLLLTFPARSNSYHSFDNFILSVDANSVRFFLQDEQGLLWMGTNKGLFSYDGYRSFPHFLPGSAENRTIHCGLLYHDDYFLLGTERGLLLYNFKFDKYVPIEPEMTNDIRAMVLCGKDLWLGCVDGLYKYDLQSKVLKKMLPTTEDGRPTGIVYALVEDNGYLYVGASRLFGRFWLEDNRFEFLGRRLVNSLRKDKARNCIWIGEGNCLTRYTPSSGIFESISGFPVVKSIELDCDQNLVLGTDNGLYIYDPKEIRHFVHNTQKINSLANNVVWSLFRDRSDNVWLGTDYGISMAPRHRRFDYIPLFYFSGTGEGNQFSTLLRDSKGYYWFGGDNGLLRTRQLTAVDSEIRWYNMSDGKYYIPHNQIRDILEDTMHNLWIATDFGMGRFDDQTGKFAVYQIRNEENTKSAHWAYDILEDRAGNLWVSSFDGGVFKIHKTRFESRQHSLVADVNYSTTNGLRSNHVDRIVLDSTGKIWALCRNCGIDIIADATGVVTSFPEQNHTNGNSVTSIMSDSDGYIWIGFRNGVTRIDPVKYTSTIIPFANADNAVVYAILEVNHSLWITSTEGLWIVDKESLSVRHINLTEKVFRGAFYDNEIQQVILGGADGIAICSPLIAEEPDQSEKVVITSLLVNGQTYRNANEELVVRYNSSVALPYHQNNITIKFSDLKYASPGMRRTYVYRLNCDEENWTSLKTNENTISLSKLTPGKYQLIIAQKGSKGVPVRELKSFSIVIHPPWYYCRLALLFYFLLLSALMLWVIKFFHQRHNLKIARIEREKTLEQAQMKVDFFTNIAHEFKTPLSLITAPLSRLIHDKKYKSEKETLDMIHQSAMKLNSLVQQAIDYYKEDSDSSMGLVLSRVEFVEFARSIFLAYQMHMKERQIEFVFHTDVDKLYLDADLLKMESILNNLLSNACKYTNPGDTILFSLRYTPGDNHFEFVVSDSGIGIEEKDIPYIFQRFFQSPSNKERGGTGIGLYLVKKFAEQHGGTVQVVSNTMKGTSFVVRLPVMMSPARETPPAGDPADIEIQDKPFLLIVEDNVAIANFIYRSFIQDFRCVVARNGKSGLKICTDLHPDIIIADMMMPVMDGLEMSKKIKENISTSTIPIILLTAKDDKATELQSMNLKIDAFIAKPFDYDILYSRVKQLLEAKKSWERKIRIEELSTPVEEKDVSVDEKFLAGITRLIEEQMDNPDLNVSFLCEAMGVSQKQMYRKIKSLTGYSPVDYIKSIRMKKAAILLSNKNFTVSEVMYKVGFSNHSYFARCFYHEFGKKPSEF